MGLSPHRPFSVTSCPSCSGPWPWLFAERFIGFAVPHGAGLDVDGYKKLVDLLLRYAEDTAGLRLGILLEPQVQDLPLSG